MGGNFEEPAGSVALANMKSKDSLSRRKTICVVSHTPGSRFGYTPTSDGAQSFEDKIKLFLRHFKKKNRTPNDLSASFEYLRKLVLLYGIPEEVKPYNQNAGCSIRAKVWKIFLEVYDVTAAEYINLVRRSPSDQYHKIKNDAFRTLATDKKFLNRVDESLMLRILNAFVVKYDDSQKKSKTKWKLTYVQGMNVLLAPFLYVMPELDSFFSFCSFIQHMCPSYVQPTLGGVYTGLKLLDKCLQICDPELHKVLAEKNLDPLIYAFPSVLTFCACTPPLDEVIKLWDHYICFGVHLNIIAIVSQLVAMRDLVVHSDSPMKVLRTFPSLNSKRIIKDIPIFLSNIPASLQQQLVLHTHTHI